MAAAPGSTPATSRIEALISEIEARGQAAELAELAKGKDKTFACGINHAVQMGALKGVLRFGGALPTPANGYHVMAARLGAAHVHVEYDPTGDEPVITAALVNGEWVSCCPGEMFSDVQLREWEAAALRDLQALEREEAGVLPLRRAA